MRLRIATLAAVTAATLVMPISAPPASAVPPLRFSYVQYDSPGSDDGSNASLNAEWIRVKNFGSRTRTLTGWRIRDAAGHVYVFPEFRLRPDRSVRIHTGNGADTGTELYMDRDWYVWNNTGDTATLKNRALDVIDRCSWGDGDGSKAC
jgi:Lamin Tail Domain